MTGRQSAVMDKAIRLIMAGKTATEAAKKSGVRRESIYRHPDYKAYRQAKKQGNNA